MPKTITWESEADGTDGASETQGPGGSSHIGSAYAPMDATCASDETSNDDDTDDDDETGDEDNDHNKNAAVPPTATSTIGEQCASLAVLWLLLFSIASGIGAAVVHFDRDAAKSGPRVEATNAAGAVASLLQRLDNATHRLVEQGGHKTRSMRWARLHWPPPPAVPAVLVHPLASASPPPLSAKVSHNNTH